MEVKDFKVGQTVFVELTGNAKNYKKEYELIEEWEVTKVGRKYIQAKKKECGWPVTFEKIEYGYDAGEFVEKTDYEYNYILYTTKTKIEEKREYQKLYEQISRRFEASIWASDLSLEQLRKINSIISAEE